MHSVRVASCILVAGVHLKAHTLVERAIAEKEATGEEPKIFLTERGQVRFCIYLNEISTSCPDRRDTGAPVRTQARPYSLSERTPPESQYYGKPPARTRMESALTKPCAGVRLTRETKARTGEDGRGRAKKVESTQLNARAVILV
jgi:hypothetical protein